LVQPYREAAVVAVGRSWVRDGVARTVIASRALSVCSVLGLGVTAADVEESSAAGVARYERSDAAGPQAVAAEPTAQAQTTPIDRRTRRTASWRGTGGADPTAIFTVHPA
jgi:hypothetical protein